jgi:ABC-type amino acid transport substrate-binding protein
MGPDDRTGGHLLRTSVMQRRLVLAVLAIFSLCATTACQPGPGVARPNARPLRVGVTVDSPPFVVKQGQDLAGVEIDFARALEGQLGRPVRFVSLPWSEQIPTLLRGDTDVIMSGLTATRAREATLAFTRPYLRSGLFALVRRKDVGRYPSRDALWGSNARFGVLAGSTAERLVRERDDLASVSAYSTTTSATLELLQQRIDVFVHDGPTVGWLASQDEARLAPVLVKLADEPIAWGVRRDDQALAAALDDALARLDADGSRARILDRWIPYWKRLEATPSAR